MSEIGRLLVIFGIVLIVVGVVVMLLGRTGLPLGRLPGDIVYRGKNTTFYFPLATSILLSVVLSLIAFRHQPPETIVPLRILVVPRVARGIRGHPVWRSANDLTTNDQRLFPAG